MEVLCQLSYSPEFGTTEITNDSKAFPTRQRRRLARRRCRIGSTMNCMTTVTTAMLVNTRRINGILTNNGAATSDTNSATGYTHATSIDSFFHNGRFGSALPAASNHSSTPTVRCIRVLVTNLSLRSINSLRTAERSHSRNITPSENLTMIWYSPPATPGCSTTAPRQPGNSRTAATPSSAHFRNCASQPGATVRATVTVTGNGASRGSCPVSNGPESGSAMVALTLVTRAASTVDALILRRSANRSSARLDRAA